MKKIFSYAFITTVAVTALAFTTITSDNKTKSPVKYAFANDVTKWTIDKAHSGVKFTVTHMVVSEVEGSFKIFDGSMENTKPDFSDAKISFTVDINSVNTDNEMRDKHLKSDDFFNAEKFPMMTFTGTSFTPAGGNKYKLAGNLTIRDVTKPVVFDVTYGGTVNAMGGTRMGFKAKTTIDRFDYNLKWNKTIEAGGLVASKEVDITVNIELKKS
ncbi:MAG: YceI family protein [Ginsengibacter sp.]